jgi:hypothetical protein
VRWYLRFKLSYRDLAGFLRPEGRPRSGLRFCLSTGNQSELESRGEANPGLIFVLSVCHRCAAPASQACWHSPRVSLVPPLRRRSRLKITVPSLSSMSSWFPRDTSWLRAQPGCTAHRFSRPLPSGPWIGGIGDELSGQITICNFCNG